MENELFLIALGARIKKIRSEKKITQQDLAGACNFEKANMSRIERGKTNPTVITLLKISAALEINLAELLDHSDLTTQIKND